MKTVLSVIVGSRLHGTATPESDYDYRGVFMNDIEDILSPFRSPKENSWIEGEADETYVGGKRKGMRGRGAAGKTVVFGKLERATKRVNTAIVPNVKAVSLLPHFTDNVAKGTKLITDELRSYRKIVKILDVQHDTVNHGAAQELQDATQAKLDAANKAKQLRKELCTQFHLQRASGGYFVQATAPCL